MLHILTLRRSLVVVAVALILAFAPLVAPLVAQAQGDIAVIVHPDVAVENLTLADLRRILTGDREFWASSGRVTIFIRAPVARERDDQRHGHDCERAAKRQNVKHS